MLWSGSPTSPRTTLLPDLHPLLAQTLLRRGIATPEAARAFLDPDSYRPAPALDLPGMDAALARVGDALQRGEPICIWGDFDVDGQTATAILVSALRSLGGDVTYHLPVRALESHGINLPQLKEILDRGAQVVITCDTGITSQDAVEYAQSRGVDMVITDHHDLGERLPAAAAVTNPKLLPLEHPLSSLPGAGVAYKLAEALVTAHPGSAITSKDLLDLTVLGIIGDLALLRGDTRYLAQVGLAQLRRTDRRGLRAMMELAQIVPANLNEEHIGFELAPRLNALGRLGDANPAVELLLTSDPARAHVLATQLEGLNTQRKLLAKQVYQAAEAQLREDPGLLTEPVIILAHDQWHGGVIGLVASRIARRYGKPAILFTTGKDGLARGSARSIDGLHITAAIAAQRSLLHSFGGHPMAAGLSLEAGKLPQFRKDMARTVEKMLADAGLEEAVLHIDAWLELPEIDLGLTDQIERLAPFGPGNEKLILATRNLGTRSSTVIGRNAEHLKLTVEDAAGNAQRVLWWNGAGEPLPEGRFDLAYTVRASDFRGARQVTVELVDCRGVVEGGDSQSAGREEREFVDWRAEKNRQARLGELRESADFKGVIWAEGAQKREVGGLGRHELVRAETLVIWSVPPSRDVLTDALERVGPSRVVIAGVDPGEDDPKSFLELLLGLVKFAIDRRGGYATWAELAAATAQREELVRLGVEWLQMRGQVTRKLAPEGVRLGAANAEPREEASAAALSRIEHLLNETAGYRAYFIRAEKPVE